MEKRTNRRKRYDAQTYTTLTAELLKTLQETPHLTPSREDWDLDGDWSRAGTLHFIDSQYMASFQPFADFDCRTIKLINFGKPAVRMTFNAVHKYYLIKSKDFSLSDRSQRINDYINNLSISIEILKERMERMTAVKRSESYGKLDAMRQEIGQWSLIRDNPDVYELVLSNYHREHNYTNINWKFATGEMEFAIGQEHLLTTTHDSLGNVVQVKNNIVFVDSAEILRIHTYQNKTIDRYLNGFPIRSQFNRDQLYARFQPNPDAVEAFDGAAIPSPVVLQETDDFLQNQGKKSNRNDTLSNELPSDGQFGLFD